MASTFLDTADAISSGWKQLKNACSHLKDLISNTAPFKAISKRLCEPNGQGVLYIASTTASPERAIILEAKKELTVLDKAAVDFGTALSEANAKLREANSDNAQMTHDLQDLKTRLQTAQDEALELNNEKEAIREVLDSANGKNSDLTTELARLKLELETLKERQQAVFKMVGGLTHQITTVVAATEM
ncbi:hypothetical protein [Parendozoicomonas sp. Alg238-R29]|uniref:hypothetical protein n=1 Tax=Parendozoicomonas sp. Alg238-R29 TaxID=2993446 RepID=UPI00248DD1D5|nr:hypothetical protein [Parendozoicomonas sp. Alg238-R29]